ncbi:cofactor assembly of complex C subunit B [Picosynechococcus sp. NKBG15041c]|uniref:cofactor assembly of complex C subunit B n=1 Tax=Picosynechococcus sp. NKBG15041c TaxID=1407650 RepID=UPI00041D6305|nr:cofactor assembly of complex C subunit B [Picosynechococcus sp. NKBG15041c]
MADSKQNSLRYLPLTVGVIGGTMLMANRLLTPILSESQARSDVVGVILSAVLILVTLLWEQIQPRTPEAVILEGTEQFELTADLPETIRTELAWASHLLLTNTVTKSLVLYYNDQIILRRGVFGEKKAFNLGAIAKRVLETQKAVYLVTLKVYPGRVEFDYLPENTQGIICQPVGSKGLLVLGTNIPRSYTKQDENWVAALAEKLAITLENT